MFCLIWILFLIYTVWVSISWSCVLKPNVSTLSWSCLDPRYASVFKWSWSGLVWMDISLLSFVRPPVKWLFCEADEEPCVLADIPGWNANLLAFHKASSELVGSAICSQGNSGDLEGDLKNVFVFGTKGTGGLEQLEGSFVCLFFFKCYSCFLLFSLIFSSPCVFQCLSLSV